jgi:hypothetical protein
VLIQTASVGAITRLQKIDSFAALIETMRRRARRVYVMPAHNLDANHAASMPIYCRLA